MSQENYVGTNKLLVGLVLAVLSFWLFAQSLLNISPAVQQSLGLADATITTGVSITSLIAGLFIVVAGGFADRFGRVKFSLFGLGLNILGSLCLVLATSAPLFLAGRVLQGFASACIMPATLALVKAYYEGENRQRAVSYWSMGTWGGTGLASFFGGAVSGALGWKYIFIFSIIASVTSFALIWGTPESKVDNPVKGFDYLGLVIFIVSMLALNLGITSVKENGFASKTLIYLAIFAISLAIFYFVEKSKTIKFIDFKLFSNKYFLGASLSNFLLNTVAGTLIVINTYLQKGRGLSASTSGLLSLGYLACVLITIRIGEVLLKKWGARKPMLLGPCITFIGVLLMTLVNIQGSAYYVVVFIGYALFGTGLGIYATPSTDTAISHVDEAEVGAASGIYKMASSLGNSLGTAISLTVFLAFSASGNYDQAALSGLITNLICCALSITSILLIVPNEK
ncbi:MFS transporter [Streptococcus loxodontisalivarius]|uniref:DHA2 family multidrug resistance protein-like MFS transporter n=1 Tax=Streptococcus loxodontisalivarius TaxID=1349415 RepID=A0ABS2PQF1_9STRE|nr:MFS transporter [Streptococcus loxodontisalivarius]MBM7642269.1 DHA2 family multidrug resistance protein-like MFS transporter [Streptococcus loxodontisalivarius]